MRYAVTINQQTNGTFLATVPALPAIRQVGRSREATLHAVREAIREELSKTEIVFVDVSNDADSKRDNPWLETAGMFAADETLLPMLEQIYRQRDE